VAELASIPTERGDVLVLVTALKPASYAIATVSVDGQQDFGAGYNLLNLPHLAEALKQARALLLPGRRIYVLTVDTGEWTVIAGGTPSRLV
jgi:hypothetical protein